MDQRMLMMLPGIQPDELRMLENMTKGLSDEQIGMFISMYSSKRKAPDTILLTTAIGFVGFNGIQRFLIGQVGMGILYFLTGGLCLIGTIMDLINHKQLASEYNQQQAMETMGMIRR